MINFIESENILNVNYELLNNTFYKGIIIEESLTDIKILNDIKIIDTEIANGGTWTIRTVNISKEQISKLSTLINDNKWYMHFWKDKNIIVVFKDKIFNINYDDKTTWKEAINYGIKIEIQLEQLDFPIE